MRSHMGFHFCYVLHFKPEDIQAKNRQKGNSFQKTVNGIKIVSLSFTSECDSRNLTVVNGTYNLPGHTWKPLM